jgi:hypothetical protein
MLNLLIILLLLSLVNSLNLFNKSKVSKISSIELKDKIRALSRNTDNGIKADMKAKEEIAATVKLLEAMNPTKDLTSNKKLDGDWKLIYTTNEGSSAGKIGPFVGQVNQIISYNDKEYVNTVNIGNIVVASLAATWIKQSNSIWEVIFKSIEFRILGFKIIDKPLTAKGIWRKSYVDDSFRILYAKGGKNEVKENIYILEK